jgi:hypothetical protein
MSAPQELKLSKAAKSLIVAIKALEKIKRNSTHMNSLTASDTAREALHEISRIHGWEITD